jgi:hypothetical protein
MPNDVIQRMSKNAGSNSTMKSGKGHFAGAMHRLAKLRSSSRSVNPLQVGNVLTKHAPQGGTANFDSKIDKPEGEGRKVQSTEGQTALDPKQQGPSNKHMQRGKGAS